LVRAVAQGRGGFPNEVRQYSGKRGVRSIRPFRGTSKVRGEWRSQDSLERDGPRQQIRSRGAARDRPCIGVPIQVIGRARPPVPLAARRRRQCKPQQGLHLVECEDDVRGVTMFEVGVERQVPTGHTPRRRRRRKRSRPALWNAGRPPTPCPCPCEQRRSIHARIAAPTSPVMSALYSLRVGASCSQLHTSPDRGDITSARRQPTPQPPDRRVSARC